MKKIYLIFSCLVLVICLKAQSPSYQWAKNLSGTQIDIEDDIFVDALGNTYITGSFIGTVDFDPGVGTQNLTSTVNGGCSCNTEDVFFAKYDINGNYVWAYKIGGNVNNINADKGSGIIVDSNGNIFITGRFAGTVDFDPGPGIVNLTSLATPDVFVAKYDVELQA